MSDEPPDTDAEIGSQAAMAAVGALAEPVRRLLYRYVTARSDGVSRDQAADGVGVAHHVAKFHLDRLEADGLLDAEYRRPPGRGGPGAGRPAKMYRRSAREIAVSLPQRRYDLAAQVMADAISASETSGAPISQTLRVAARATGHRIGARARTAADETVDASRLLCDALEAQGFEPDRSDGVITLRNCPFHSLASAHTELVCGMNLDLINGAVEELESPQLRPRLDPAPGRCCVTVADNR